MSGTFRQDKLTDFTVIRNAIFKDYRLSAKAVGVACKLLSLPTDWEYSVKGITSLFSDGETSIRSAVSELEEFGYLRREQRRADGKFAASVYVIADTTKRDNPFAENPSSDNPSADERPQYNTKEYNTKELNTNNNNKSINRVYRFIPPSLEMVRDYIAEKGYSIDAERFIDYYTANGWMVGKNRMKDWKATVRNWARNGNGTNTRACNGKRDIISETAGQSKGGTSEFQPFVSATEVFVAKDD